MSPRHPTGSPGFSLPELLMATAVLVALAAALATMAVGTARMGKAAQRHLDQMAGIQQAAQQFAVDMRRGRQWTAPTHTDCRADPDSPDPPPAGSGYKATAVETPDGERIAYCWYNGVLYRRENGARPQPIARGVEVYFGVPENLQVGWYFSLYTCQEQSTAAGEPTLCIHLAREEQWAPPGGLWQPRNSVWTSAYLTGREAP